MYAILFRECWQYDLRKLGAHIQEVKVRVGQLRICEHDRHPAVGHDHKHETKGDVVFVMAFGSGAPFYPSALQQWRRDDMIRTHNYFSKEANRKYGEVPPIPPSLPAKRRGGNRLLRKPPRPQANR